jgi:hypothetical protein
MRHQDGLFAGRVLTAYVSLEGERGRGLVMHDCSLREIAGRAFLVGTCAETGCTGKDEWMAGVDAAIPWDTVASVFLMTEEQYEERKRGS